jgi:hypothetical protein
VKRNHLTGLLLVLALAGLGWWLFENTHWETVENRTPLKGDARTNMFYAAQHLAESLGAHTKVGYDTLTLPSTRSVVVLGFWNWGLVPDRRARLQRWVEDGGRLVVGMNIIANGDFGDWSGVKPLLWKEKEERDKLSRAPPLCPPATRRLTAVPGEHYDICASMPTPGLGTTRKYSWRLQDRDGRTQALRIPVGRGSITMVNAMPFDNLAILCGDSALLFTAATQLHRGDEIDFLRDGSGGSLLSLMWTYGSPVIVLGALLVVLWLWRSGVRFGPLAAAPDPARRSLAEQIRGTGQFTLRFGGGKALYGATVRAMNEAAARRFPHYERLSGEQRVAALASFTGLDSGELAAALHSPAARRPQEIRKTIAFLETVRRQLAHAREITENHREGSEHEQ